MAKHKHEEHENHERWLVSYADFITLLFAFFVVMYSISSVNEGKYKVFSDSLGNAFSRQEGAAKDSVEAGQAYPMPNPALKRRAEAMRREKERLTRLGASPIGSSPQKFDAKIRADYKKWGPIIEAAGMKAE